MSSIQAALYCLLRLCLFVLLCVLRISGAGAAELRVICPNALREPMLELARAFVMASGDRVEFIFASVGAIHKRVAAGERADIAIGTADGVEALIKLGPALEGSQAIIARSALALAGRAWTIGPNAARADGLERALTAARVIAAPDPRSGVPGGAQVEELFHALKLADVLAPKMRWQLDIRDAVKRIGSGEIDFVIAPMSDLAGSKDVEVIGPLVPMLTRGVAYSAFIPRAASNTERSRAFIQHLGSAQAERVFRRAGYLTGG